MDAELHEVRRQHQDFAEMAVGADQLQVDVEHGDALPHMVERRLQDLPVEMRRRVGIVEQLESGLGRHRALAQQKRHDET